MRSPQKAADHPGVTPTERPLGAAQRHYLELFTAYLGCNPIEREVLPLTRRKDEALNYVLLEARLDPVRSIR